MIIVIARWRPNRKAISFPRMLDGIARTENTKLMTIGVRNADPSPLAATKAQNATNHG